MRRLLRADDIPLDTVEQVGRVVVAAVGEKRSTWRRANLCAEASRQTIDWRFATTRDREAITGMVVDAAESASLRLTPPDLATTPAVFTREDGSSRFRPKHSVVFSSEQILAAEDRLLKRAETRTAPTVDVEAIDRHAAELSPHQAQALALIAVSARQLDLLVGPAGAGKTTALRALHRAWTQQHGRGSVVGLAPSAAAAAVLAEDLGVTCENTAKWLYEHQQGRARFHRRQLVIIDEATLAGTFTLDRITGHAAQAGAKVLLVGDWAQLQAVEAGGAFALLASARDDAPELVGIHRFTHEWEKTASLDLRHGRPEAVDAYLAHGRVQSGDDEDITDAAYQAWRADTDLGRATVLIADSNAAVRGLNERARAERLLTGAPRRDSKHTLLMGPVPRPVIWSSRGATTGACGPGAMAGSATATGGASPPSATTVHSWYGVSGLDAAEPSFCPPATSPSTSTSATPSPLTEPKPSPSTPHTSSSPTARRGRTSTSR